MTDKEFMEAVIEIMAPFVIAAAIRDAVLTEMIVGTYAATAMDNVVRDKRDEANVKLTELMRTYNNG